MVDFDFKEFFIENKIKIIILILLIIPIFFGTNLVYLLSSFNIILVWEIELFFIFIAFIAFFYVVCIYLIFFALDYEYPEYISEIREHPMVKIHLQRDFFVNNRYEILLSYTLSIIFEEFLFRMYLLGFLLNFENFQPIMAFDYGYIGDFFYPILSSSILFSGYHIYTFFKAESLSLTVFYMLSSFILGIINGISFIYGGILFSIIVYWIITYSIYSIIGRHYVLKEK